MEEHNVKNERMSQQFPAFYLSDDAFSNRTQNLVTFSNEIGNVMVNVLDDKLLTFIISSFFPRINTLERKSPFNNSIKIAKIVNL